jgi:hypothetical protein
VIDGVEHYYAPGGPLPVTEGPRIDLIQCYDEYVMGYFATRHYLGGGAPAFPFEGEPMHVVLLDGRMAGSWRHTLRPDRCELDIRIAHTAGDTPGSPVGDAIQEAVDRYAVFMRLPAVRVPSGAKLEGHP